VLLNVKQRIRLGVGQFDTFFFKKTSFKGYLLAEGLLSTLETLKMPSLTFPLTHLHFSEHNSHAKWGIEEKTPVFKIFN